MASDGEVASYVSAAVLLVAASGAAQSCSPTAAAATAAHASCVEQLDQVRFLGLPDYRFIRL